MGYWRAVRGWGMADESPELVRGYRLYAGDVVTVVGGTRTVTQSCAEIEGDGWCLAFDEGPLIHFPPERSFVRVRRGDRG